MSELNWHSHVVWQFVAPVNLGVGDFDQGVIFHHDVVRRANGNTLILCSVQIQVPTISPNVLTDDCILAKRVSTDTGGEFIFAVLTKLTTGGFKHLLTVNRAYFRIRHQY